jgi:hypothetical protein
MIELDPIDSLEDDVLEDVEPYEGSPAYLYPVTLDGDQDDEGLEHEPEDSALMPREIVGLLARVNNSPNTWRETLDWFKSHRTKERIGFDPDGMCLKIQRTARAIPPRYLTARESMMATPMEYRHTRVRDLRRGMVAYYADPFDNNPADHIVGVIGRVKDFDPDDLNDVLMITNSVKQNELVIVRGTYFEQHWGDDFKFGATWLNGYELDTPAGEKKSKVEKFHDSAPKYNLRLLHRSDRAKAQRILDQIDRQVRRLPDSPKLVRVHEFKLQVKDDRILDLRILDDAVKAGRVGVVKSVRDELRRLIKALPEE